MKLALITGASAGLGKELCKLLATKDYQLLVTGRNPDQFPPALDSVTADLVTERDKVIDLIHRYTPDLVINNAGFTVYGPAIDSNLDIFEVNANAAIELTIEAARALRAANKKGIILNVSSIASELPIPYMALYAAAKAALTSFSQSFDAEMRKFGIRILVALPGPIDTEFASRASKGKFMKKEGLTKEVVAKRIWEQIEKQQPFQIIDWKNRVQLFLAKLFPRIAEKIVAKSIEERF